MSKKRCCGAYTIKKPVAVPDYVSRVMQTQEATILVQFREPYVIESEGIMHNFRASQQARLPYSMVYDLYRMQHAPLYIVRPYEKEQFFAAYGIVE